MSAMAAPGTIERPRPLVAGLVDKLVSPMPTDRLLGWLLPLAVTVFAGVIRFMHLGRPASLIFDEVYYVHDSNNLIHVGVELNNGNTGPGFVVHPPIGKWMIGFGQWLFCGPGTFTYKGGIYPTHAFGWRFSSAVVGTLAVLILARSARRMFRSTVLGTVAGLLLALDGLEFVQSRIAMLDIYLMFWLVCAFACLVLDRDERRRRLAERLSRDSAPGPLGWRRWRPWRLAAGLCLGLAMASKWNGAYFVPAFVLLSYAWDVRARRAGGLPRPRRAALRWDARSTLGAFVLLPLAVYVASWTGWFLGNAHTAFDHDLYTRAGQSGLSYVLAVLHGWLTYQHQILHFDETLSAGHPYLSYPLGWIVLARPIAYYYSGAATSCGAHSCSQEVLAVGTPAIWWASVPALVVMCWQWIRRRDWRSGAVLCFFAFAWLPWFYEWTQQRTMFFFYMLPAVPFMVLAVTHTIGLVLGPRGARPRRRRLAAAGTGAYLLLVLWNFSYLYPILSGQVITYQQWHNRMLFQHCATKNERHENAPCWI